MCGLTACHVVVYSHYRMCFDEPRPKRPTALADGSPPLRQRPKSFDGAPRIGTPDGSLGAPRLGVAYGSASPRRQVCRTKRMPQERNFLLSSASQFAQVVASICCLLTCDDDCSHRSHASALAHVSAGERPAAQEDGKVLKMGVLATTEATALVREDQFGAARTTYR